MTNTIPQYLYVQIALIMHSIDKLQKFYEFYNYMYICIYIYIQLKIYPKKGTINQHQSQSYCLIIIRKISEHIYYHDEHSRYDNIDIISILYLYYNSYYTRVKQASNNHMFKQFVLYVFMVLPSVMGSLTVADFLFQPQYTSSYFWSNYVGAAVDLSEIINYYNTSLFQGYVLNSNLKGNWDNNFMFNLRSPKGWFYNCTAANRNPNDTVSCPVQLVGNMTFFDQLGQFVWNTMSQPYWTFGVNNQLLNLNDTKLIESMYDFYIQIYKSTHYISYMIEMMYQGDMAVQNGMRTAYNVTTFLQDAWQYQEILFGLNYKSPGLTENASSQWMGNLTKFFDQCWFGIFTFESVIFSNPSLATIQNLLNDNYTKGYLKRRTYVNSSFSFSDFSKYTASITRTRLVLGEGIDGITNTMAAAIWWIDFIMQSLRYGFFDVSIEGAFRAGNYQSIFNGPPNYSPSALYYGSLMAILAGDSIPKLMLPKYTAGTSGNIKIWGLTHKLVLKFLILNKDMNTSLDGNVLIQVKSQANVKMQCIYLQAPSLTSKSDAMKIGGHTFVDNNFTAQGNYSKIYYNYDPSQRSYAVKLKYAQVALCQIRNPDYVIPTIDVNNCFSQIMYMNLILLGIFGIALLI